MSEVDKFIASGILEMYVMGQTSKEENALVEHMRSQYEEVRQELYSIEEVLEKYALSRSEAVDPTVKPFLMATIDYLDRMNSGEPPSYPPEVTPHSKVSDYAPWLNRPDLGLTRPLEEIDARIIGSTPERMIAIVWIRNGAPPEVHKKELESFLVVEGTCNIVVNEKDNHLKPGDIFTIPLYAVHHVVITSDIPCKIILQRLAV